MEKVVNGISVNWEVAKRKGKDKFLASNKHLNAEEQLSEMFDKVVPPKKPEKPSSGEKKK